MPDVVGGLDVVAVGRWLTQHCDLASPVTVVPVAGGRSNLTSIVTDAHGRCVVVRRPPLSGVLASAHDVLREGRIMAALAATDVPVPSVLGGEEDPSVTGAPFLVMEHVAGSVLRSSAEAQGIAAEARRELGLAALDTLAALHAIDVDTVGLGGLARRDGYLARQLSRWSGQLATAGTRALPDLKTVHDRLVASLPAQQRLALVHGDYRLDNLIVDVSELRIRAVLDWELATLGDPLADLALLLVYWGEPGGVESVLPDAPTSLVGFPSPVELVQRYALRTGEDPDALELRLRPYLAFALFKLACILEGVRIRSVAGAYGSVGEGPGMAEEAERYVELVPELAARALRLV
jgi:aminoglycoside phosphotransferase (APT) family kinase protein